MTVQPVAIRWGLNPEQIERIVVSLVSVRYTIRYHQIVASAFSRQSMADHNNV
jgi:hypothetical protein